MLISQILKSKLSKQGKTSLTGIFEGQPSNTLVASRGFTTPTGNAMIDQPIVNSVNFRNTQRPAETYLEHMKQERRL